MGPIIVSTLQMRKLRFRKANTFVRLINGRIGFIPQTTP